jgi:Nucleoside 2-deoxyribosyltransferase
MSKSSEGILDRIFNQISKADVIVADMTGRNPNVFYEVGYAHALGKIVILLTQNTDDIPFDLKHRQHTVYGGKIEVLRKELAAKLQWAIAEARGRTGFTTPVRISVRVLGTEVPAVGSSNQQTRIVGVAQGRVSNLPVHIRNDSLEVLRAISHVYLFAHQDSKFVPASSSHSYLNNSGLWSSSMTLRTSNDPEPLSFFWLVPLMPLTVYQSSFALPRMFLSFPRVQLKKS